MGPVFLRASQVGQATGLLTVPVAMVLGSVALNLPMLLSAAVRFAQTLFLILFMPERGFRPAPRAGRSSWRAMADTLLEGGRLVQARPRFLWIFGIAAFFGMASEGIDRLSTPHFLRTVGFPDLGHFQPVVWFGAMDICASVLIIAANEVVRRRLDTADQRATAPALLALNFLQIASVLGFAAATDFPTAFLAYLGLTVFRHLFLPVYDAWLNQGIDSRVRATVLSMSSQSNAIGQVVGGPIVGAIGSAISLRAALAASGVVLAPALLLYRRASRPHAAAGLAEGVGGALPPPASADASAAGAGVARAREG